MAPEQIAQVGYEVMRAYNMAKGGAMQPSWKSAPPELRNSMLMKVAMTLSDPEQGPKEPKDGKSLDTDYMFRCLVLSLADGV